MKAPKMERCSVAHHVPELSKPAAASSVGDARRTPWVDQRPSASRNAQILCSWDWRPTDSRENREQ